MARKMNACLGPLGSWGEAQGSGGSRDLFVVYGGEYLVEQTSAKPEEIGLSCVVE